MIKLSDEYMKFLQLIEAWKDKKDNQIDTIK